jgi:predicted Zn-dependent peptidase
MEAELHHLAGGVRLALDPMPSLQTVSISVTMGVGARAEEPSENGVAHLFEHMAFKGAGGRDARGLAEAIERLGASVDAGTGYERTSYAARGLSEDVAALIDILADMVLEPRLDSDDLAREKNVVLQEIAEANDQPDDRVFELHQGGVFAGHSLGRPILGTPETLDAISLDTLRGFHARALDASRIVVSIAGGFDSAEIQDRVGARFGALTSRKANANAPARARACTLMETRKTAQTQLVLSWNAPKAADEDAIAARIACEILGGGASSRLFQEVREARGLVYGIDAWLDLYDDVGRFGISAGCDPANATEVASIAADQVAALAEHGPSADEMARAKAVMRARILMATEAPAARAEGRSAQVFLRGELMSFSDLANRVLAVTAADVQKACARIFDGGVAAATLGPKRGLAAASTFTSRFAA